MECTTSPGEGKFFLSQERWNEHPVDGPLLFLSFECNDSSLLEGYRFFSLIPREEERGECAQVGEVANEHDIFLSSLKVTRDEVNIIMRVHVISLDHTSLWM